MKPITMKLGSSDFCRSLYIKGALEYKSALCQGLFLKEFIDFVLAKAFCEFEDLRLFLYRHIYRHRRI